MHTKDTYICWLTVGLDDGALEGADYFKVVRRKRDVRGYIYYNSYNCKIHMFVNLP